uniref:Uncharacterized protein n=1 Tax=Meloidogyne hapla TaxID=6305 RepID=A0A1I8BF01_MELHA
MSSLMSISNPFFDYSTNSSSSNSSIPPFLTPPLKRAAALNENKLKNKKENNETLKQQKSSFGNCCAENPFTQDEGNGLFDSRISQSSSAVVDSMISEGFVVSSSSTTVPGISNVVSTKMLQDSGYRSTISNSNFEEEMAIAEKERREERERRRQRRKTGGNQQRKTKEEMTVTTNKNNNSSSVPAFLRRTCSNAANGINAIKPSGWIGASIMKASTSDDNVKVKSIPRRTQSIGCSTTQIPPTFLYSTGWMVEADLSSDDSNNEKIEIFGGNNCEGFFLILK